MQTKHLSVLGTMAELRARVGRPQTSVSPSNFIAGLPKAAVLFWFFGNFRWACCYLWLFSLYINIKKVLKC